MTLAFCHVVAVFLWLLTRESFGEQWLISLCIGMSCHVYIELGRALLARRQGAAAEWPSWFALALWVPLAAIAGALTGAALSDAIAGGHRLQNILSSRPALQFTLAVSLASSVIGTLWFLTRHQLQQARMLTEQSAREAAEAQLKLLQGQLEPHMLFNTLANLRVLIGTDPPRAQAMLDRLNAFLRASLEASRSERPWTLAAEFERVSDYLALMQVRMGPRLAVRLDLPAELAATPVPPLLLQPLVENAIRHGLEPKLEGGRVEVRARAERAALQLEVRDTGVGLGADAEGDSTRFGLEQVRTRLRVLHGAHAQLELLPAAGTEGGTLARITLPHDQARTP